MADNYRYEGKRMEITASGDKSSGDLVVVEDIAAVCLGDIDDTESGPAAIEGVFELTKEAGESGKALDQGKKVYWNATEKRVENAAGDPALPCIGIAFEDAATDATSCLVKINVGI